MKFFAAFLLTMFVLGAIPKGRLPISRPKAYFVVCILVGISFYSLKVLE